MHVLGMVLLILLWWTSSGAEAACTGSGTSWSCSAGSSSSDIQAALSSATDGATITFQPGSYTITSLVQFIPGKGATLLCATVPLANGANTTNPCTINIGAANGPIFGSLSFGNATYSQCYRVSGFVFDGGGTYMSSYGSPFYFDNGNSPGGTHTVMTCLRLDHNTFRNFPQDQKVGLRVGHSASPFNSGNYYGLVDHNTWNNSTNLIVLFYEGAINFNPPPAQSGTPSNIFFEDNVLNLGALSTNAEPCTDGWGGAAYVVRFNTSTNCRWGGHGEKHEGGFANYEFYGNRVMLNNGAASGGWFQDCTWCFQVQGSGEVTLFNNSFSATLGRSTWVLETQDYRSSHVGDTTNYTPDLGGPLPVCDGTVVNFAGKVTDGNRSPTATYQGYPCWRQVGRDYFHVLKPIYIWNNFWSDTLAQTPFLVNDIGGSPDYLTNHLRANRDYYQAVSASPQSSPTSPFNGSTGMGFGTFANRPTTCTPTPESLDAGQGGVGYWATDQGSWLNGTPSQGNWPTGQQGVLYTCSATNTWTVHYTPFMYPHPLQAGGGGTTPPPPPTGLTVK